MYDQPLNPHGKKKLKNLITLTMKLKLELKNKPILFIINTTVLELLNYIMTVVSWVVLLS